MQNMNRRRSFIALGAPTALGTRAYAQGNASRPLAVVVPFDAGGPTDAIAGELTLRMAGVLGQTLVVENRPGAGSRIGTTFEARAKPDGHTLLLTSGSSLTPQPALYQKLPHHVTHDFIGTSKINPAPRALVVNASLPINSLGEFFDGARKNPGEISIASPALGSAIHRVLEMFQAEAKLNHVPFTGSAPAATGVRHRLPGRRGVSPLHRRAGQELPARRASCRHRACRPLITGVCR